jgi:hypothetical protein
MDQRAPSPGKNGRPPRASAQTFRTQYFLTREVLDQIDDLSRVLHISRPSVVCLAVARMHEQESLLKSNGKEK